MTEWRDLALEAPEFVQWLVQTHGPLPDGPMREDDYEWAVAEYDRWVSGESVA